MPTPVGELLRAMRNQSDPPVTQEELADRLNIRQSMISKIERGVVQRPDKALLRQIAAALGVDPDLLLVAADYAPENSVIVSLDDVDEFDPWTKSFVTVETLPPEDFERLKAAVREREAAEKEREHGDGY